MNFRVSIALSLMALPTSGALVWTGAGDAISLFQEGNWLDNNNTVPAANTINPNTIVTATTGGLISIDSGTGSPSNFSNNFILPSGDSLAVSGKNLGGSGNITGGGADTLLSIGIGGTVRAASFSSFQHLNVNGGTILTNSTGGFNTATGTSNISLTNASTADLQFISGGFSLSVDGTSSINFKGGGDPINGGTVNLSLGAVVTFTLEDIGEFTAEHLSKFSVNGSPGVIGSNLSVVSDGATGSIVTAIPEPTSTLLGALSLLTLLRRKR